MQKVLKRVLNPDPFWHMQVTLRYSTGVLNTVPPMQKALKTRTKSRPLMHMYLTTGVLNTIPTKQKKQQKTNSNNAKVNVLPDLDMIGGFGFSLTDENCGVMIGRRFSAKKISNFVKREALLQQKSKTFQQILFT